MREPNFSESQLQQAVNTAFIRKVVEHHDHWPFAHVPSLFAEFDLGWDTAFHLPWLRHVPMPNGEGCNFFLQYKLSGQLTSQGAKEWSHWGREYFRFKIPHRTRDASGAFIDDFHQWDRLKALADLGYPTFYATNSTLSKIELQAKFDAGSLLDHVPLLDVGTIAGLHKHVTFTPTSRIFALHSEKEESEKSSFTRVLGLLADGAQTSLLESTEELLGVLKGMGEDDDGWSRDLARWRGDPKRSRRIDLWTKRVFLASFVRKHIGVELLWLPKEE